MIGAEEFAMMKPSARLINSSRGPIIVESALVDALANRRIAGAVIDVFNTEPLPSGHPFRRAENLLATPYIDYVSRELYEQLYGDTALNIRQVPTRSNRMSLLSGTTECRRSARQAGGH
jgi:phosphoglycerate dehydrogenase-like enzyme